MANQNEIILAGLKQLRDQLSCRPHSYTEDGAWLRCSKCGYRVRTPACYFPSSMTDEEITALMSPGTTPGHNPDNP